MNSLNSSKSSDPELYGQPLQFKYENLVLRNPEVVKLHLKTLCWYCHPLGLGNICQSCLQTRPFYYRSRKHTVDEWFNNISLKRPTKEVMIMRESTFPLYLKECHECHFIISKDYALKYILGLTSDTFELLQHLFATTYNYLQTLYNGKSQFSSDLGISNDDRPTRSV